MTLGPASGVALNVTASPSQTLEAEAVKTNSDGTGVTSIATAFDAPLAQVPFPKASTV